MPWRLSRPESRVPVLSLETALALGFVALSGLLLLAVLAFGWWDPTYDAARLEDADR